MNAFLDGFASLIDYFVTQWQQILSLTIEHIEMTAIAVGCSILIGVPLGILVSYVRKLGKPVIGIANVVQAIPSMALLGLAIPLLGIGTLPAVVMVIIYSLLPIVKNTYTGITNIDPLLVEAATGIGLTKWQVLYKIKLPMALPVIMAGVRISTVTAVRSGTSPASASCATSDVYAHTRSSCPYPITIDRSNPQSRARPAGTTSISADRKSSSSIPYASAKSERM